MEHRVSYKVYYEDTDSLGMVYHANYLKFMERGRTECLTATGRSVADWNRAGIAVVVYAMNIKFKKPAALGDTVDVVSTFRIDSEYRGTFRQLVERGGELLVSADVEVVCIDKDQKLCPMPPDLKKLAEEG